MNPAKKKFTKKFQSPLNLNEKSFKNDRTSNKNYKNSH